MYTGIRVSQIAVRNSLRKYLADELADDILNDILETDEHDHNSMVGMTCKQWENRFDYPHRVVWADDTLAGFGNRGDLVSGTYSDGIICRVNYDGYYYTLYIWVEGLSTDDKYIHAALNEYHKRQEEKNV